MLLHMPFGGFPGWHFFWPEFVEICSYSACSVFFQLIPEYCSEKRNCLFIYVNNLYWKYYQFKGLLWATVYKNEWLAKVFKPLAICFPFCQLTPLNFYFLSEMISFHHVKNLTLKEWYPWISPFKPMTSGLKSVCKYSTFCVFNLSINPVL